MFRGELTEETLVKQLFCSARSLLSAIVNKSFYRSDGTLLQRILLLAIKTSMVYALVLEMIRVKEND